MALDWLQKFYRDNHINGLDGRLDEEGRQYWLKKADENGIEQTKKDIKWAAEQNNTWDRDDLKDWVQQYYADNNIGGPGGDIDWEARQYWLTEGKNSGEAEAKRIIRDNSIDDGTWNQGNTATFDVLPASAEGGYSEYSRGNSKFKARLYKVNHKTDNKTDYDENAMKDEQYRKCSGPWWRRRCWNSTRQVPDETKRDENKLMNKM